MDEDWVNQERNWWQDYYSATGSKIDKYRGSPAHPQGIRHYYRELLFHRIRPLIKGKTWIDFGAGNSFTIIDLIHPLIYQYHYYATDISLEGLKQGEASTHQTPILSGANNPPFPNNIAYVVSCFGSLHHIPAWKSALNKMIDTLQPGGYLLLAEAITKPRIFNRWRRRSYTAAIDSPHEGDVNKGELLDLCRNRCDIELIDLSGTPFRFALIWFFRLDKLLLESYTATKTVVFLDSLWKNTLGQVHESLGPGEITILARKR